jgi:hypothetical protein
MLTSGINYRKPATSGWIGISDRERRQRLDRHQRQGTRRQRPIGMEGRPTPVRRSESHRSLCQPAVAP